MSLARPLVKEKLRPLVRPLVRGSGAATNPIAALNPILWLKASEGVQKTGGDPAGYLDTIPLWEDKSGNGNDVTQGTALSQPYYLPYDGVKYAHLSGVSGNYLSLDHPWEVGLSDVFEAEFDITFASNPSSNRQSLLDMGEPTGFKDGISIFYRTDNDTFSVFVRVSNALTQNLTVASASSTIPELVSGRVQIKAVSTLSGVEVFYRYDDLDSWISFGSVSSSRALLTRASSAFLFSRLTNGGLAGKLKYHSCKVTIASSVIVDIDIDRDATDNATSFTAGSGQVVTVNQSGDNPAQIVGSYRIKPDGVDDFFAIPTLPQFTHGTPFTAAFKLNLWNQTLDRVTWANTVSSSNRIQLVRDSSERAQIVYNVGAGDVATNRFNFPVSGIHTVIVVHDGTNYAFYSDGVAATDSGVSTTAVATSSTVGHTLAARTDGSNGSISGVNQALLIPSALSPTAVLELHNNLSA